MIGRSWCRSMRRGAVVGSSVLLSPLRGTKTERNGSRVAVVGTRNVDDLIKPLALAGGFDDL